MARHASLVVALLAAVLLTGCERADKPIEPPTEETRAITFGNELAFLRQHTDVLVLSEGDAQVAVVPKYQGRVMTSTAEGAGGMSFGWINRELIASGEHKPQFNPFGGEDRMWLGPEGGQFGLYFPPGASKEFNFADWKTPAVLDVEPWEVVEQDETSAHFRKTFSLVNFSGTKFEVQADRIVRLLGPDDVKAHFGIALPEEVKAVAFESDNRITNKGAEPWTKAKGLLSIWILCMFNPSPDTTIVIPYEEGPEDELGPVVNDAYFGEIPEERLKAKGGVIYFRADGKARGKIGLSPQRAKPMMGSYDAAYKVLTLATYTKPEGATDYVNSMWAIQKEPYKGDVVNSYNDGPTPAGPPLGPFYELESSSPAAALQPGETMQHIHRTLHVKGGEGDLQLLARRTLGVGVDEIKNAFP